MSESLDLAQLLQRAARNWRSRLIVGASVAPLLFLAAPLTAQEAEDVISAEEIQQQLVTRGLTIGEPATPEPPPSINLKVQFELNSAKLTDQARAQLDQLGAALQSDALKTNSFQIAGHTDATGSDTYNQSLSEQRAAAVKQYLMERFGITTDRLASVGFGEARLLDTADPNNGANRRVEVTNLSQ
jgi:outer membrane protein OmpA-like peptidoglycan-associated protein